MATMNNSALFGLSGRAGNLVFRMRNGKQVVGKRPVRTKPLSLEQMEITSKFKKAVAYSKQATRAADTRPLYLQKAKPGKSAHNIAVADYFNEPEINDIYTNEYTGQPGSMISIEAEDDFMVTAVHVKIINGKGVVLEEGKAVPGQWHRYWIYTARATNTSLPGTRIIVMATDLPENMTEKEITLP